MVRLNQIFLKGTDSVLNSYTQIFFSNNRIFAIILITVSFFDAVAGLSGMVAVITVNTTAYLIGFNRGNIRSGFYGFNALLVGLGLGIFYGLNAQYFLVLVFASIFTLFLTVVLEGLIGKYGLPYLSLPFLLGIWTTTLAFREFQALRMSERGLFMFNEMYASGGGIAMRIYQWFNHLNLPESVIIYFKSLGAILFQYHLFAGIIIAMGLIIYSRIAFVLSVTGFFAAYLFYEIVGGNLYELSYSYIGFNFILTSIAVGGFFIIPSRYSYLWVILLIPLISVVVTATMVLLGLFQLSIFSLPFNLIVIMFLYILKFRERFYGSPEITVYQQFSPEKNLYSSLNNRERFYDYKFHSLSLPFWGEWKVTQAHHGEYTHRREWAHAWDFEITDEQGIPYRNTGTETEEYYCYNKPVISPADGWIEEILDGIDDNKISEINLEHNWGNTVVIRHSDKLFSKLCHLRKGTFKVKKGDFVKKGDIIAHCGNSGRSPQPHLHFQVQETPYIGSATINYPIGSYILHQDRTFRLMSYNSPAKNEVVSNIHKNKPLYDAFHFVPGQTLKFVISGSADKDEKIVEWAVMTDIYNNTLIRCTDTNAKAWFRNDGSIHYFTHFEGNRNSLLFWFYLASFKIIGGFYKGLKIRDVFPANLINNKGLIFLQDLIAPFYIFLKSEYEVEYQKIKGKLSDNRITLVSSARVMRLKKVKRELNFELEIESNRIKKFIIRSGTNTVEASELPV